MSEVMPGIHVEYDDGYNPTIISPNAEFGLSFYQTRFSLMDVDVYKRFLDNAISRFRHSVTYKKYKGYLMNDLGMDHCQLLSNISGEDADIEMHHNFLTIFDIALMITEHTINTTGYISTFDLVQLLKEAHKQNMIPIVMLSKTAHQMYHNNDDMYIPAQMCFGYWIDLLTTYHRGITKKIAYQVLNYIDHSINNTAIDAKTMVSMLELKDNLESWSNYNEYGDTRRIGVISLPENNDAEWEDAK